MSKEMNNKGISLIEIIIGITIMSLFVGVATPQYTRYVERSKRVVDADTAVKIADAFTRVMAIDNPSLKVGGKYYTAVAWDNTKKMPTAETANDFLDLVFLDLGSVPKVASFKDGMWVIDYDVEDGHVEEIKIYDRANKKGYWVYPNAENFINGK